MRKHYHKLFTFLLVIALFITARMSIFTNDAVYAKQSATPQTMSRLLQPALRSNNAGSFNVTGGVSSVDWTYIGNTLTIIKSGTYAITGDGQQTSENIAVDDNFKGTIEINNINITPASPYKVAPFNIANATVNLIVRGENTLTAIDGHFSGSKPGLMVGNYGHLTIQGSGKLSATGSGGAGIGGDYSSGMGGSITIDSGVIQATSAAGAGIGVGSYSTSCGDITINGGNVTTDLPRQNRSAGIGAAFFSKAACNITINGGNISASTSTSQGGAAIGGGGYSGNAGKIIINGGVIRASVNGENSGAGIGSGFTTTDTLLFGGSVTINGGNVYAYNSADGAGIGSGTSYNTSVANKVDIVINGGTVTAETYPYGANQDIGYGKGGVPGSLIIKGGSVKAVNNKMITPTDGLGHVEYLAKMAVPTGIDKLDVDGKPYTRLGNHKADDSTFYLYLQPQYHNIAYHNWNIATKWNDSSHVFTFGSMTSNGVATNVAYDNTTSVPEPDNPTNPDWAVQVPSRITFTDDVKKYGVDVRMETVNGGSMPAYAVDVLVQSKKGYKLVLGSEGLDYDLQYRQKDDDPWQSMKKNGTQSGKIGTFAEGSSSGATIHGEAILSGTATQSGKYTDTLTYTLRKGQSQ